MVDRFPWDADLWLVPKAGGDARRLTSSPGNEALAKFSPDGAHVAFNGSYDGKNDEIVYRRYVNVATVFRRVECLDSDTPEEEPKIGLTPPPFYPPSDQSGGCGCVVRQKRPAEPFTSPTRGAGFPASTQTFST